MLTTTRRSLLAVAASVASLGAIAAPASADVFPNPGVTPYQPQYPQYVSPACRSVAANALCPTQMVAVKVPEPWLTATPCKHDTSPSYPACTTRPR